MSKNWHLEVILGFKKCVYVYDIQIWCYVTFYPCNKKTQENLF